MSALTSLLNSLREQSDQWHSNPQPQVAAAYNTTLRDLYTIGWPFSPFLVNEISYEELDKDYLARIVQLSNRCNYTLARLSEEFRATAQPGFAERYRFILEILMRSTHEHLESDTIIDFPTSWIATEELPAFYRDYLWEGKPSPFTRQELGPDGDRRILLNWDAVLDEDAEPVWLD